MFETGVPPVFRVEFNLWATSMTPEADTVSLTTTRPGGVKQNFEFKAVDDGRYLQSTTEIPEPHAFSACLRIAGREYVVEFEEDEHDHHGHSHSATQPGHAGSFTVAVFVCQSQWSNAGISSVV